MRPTEQVLVTGSTGWIGRHVCRCLKEAGCTVIACDLTPRDGPWDAFIPCDISRDSGFPLADELVSILRRDANLYLVHCAGHAHRTVETEKEQLRFDSINAEGTRRTLEWAQSIGVSRFLYVSSIAFYDWSLATVGSPLDESAGVSGTTAYARSKLKGEHYVCNSSLDTRIVRLSTVFGEGDPANFSRLASALKRRRFLIPGNGSARKSVVSVDLAGKWISEYILMDSPGHRLINLGFSKAPTLRQICEAFNEVCGFPMPPSVPERLVNVLAVGGDLITRMSPGFPLNSVNVKKLASSTWVDCGRASGLFDLTCTFKESLKTHSSYYKGL